MEAKFGDMNRGVQVGTNNGEINFRVGVPEARPKPASTVPFPRDPDFVTRDALLDQIREKASTPGSRIVLVGLGGVGKTQLAIEYARQVRQQSAETWVFWVHASNLTRCEQSLRSLADRVKIPGRDQSANMFELVANWLQDEDIGEWILILDNVDDDELFRTSPTTSPQSSVSEQPPMRYLLGITGGTIIVTSRNKSVALNITNPENIIEVQPMNQAEALALLQRKLSTQAEQESESLAQLAQELEYMPLAIVQAASYIVQRSSRCSVTQYLEKIQKSDREVVRLLHEEAGLLYRDWEAKNSILLTWQISFNYIREKWPSASDLLSLMSFFDRQSITEDVLRVRENPERRESPSHLHEDTSDDSDTDSSTPDIDADTDFGDNIMTLNNFSLINVGDDGITFTMHRLVQLTVRTWLKTHGQLERWKEQFIANLLSEFPSTGEFKNWERCRPLFPHVKEAVSQRPECIESSSLQKWTELLYRGAWYALDSGYFAESTNMAEKSRKYRLKVFGEQSVDTLASTAILATSYRVGGWWEKAEQLELQVMEISKILLGVDISETLSSMGALASIYWYQGRWREAERLELELLEIRKNKLGAEHPDTLLSMGNLASTYRSQGRWEEAERLELQVLETQKIRLGADHLDTLFSMSNLALTYGEQGRWEDAEKLELYMVETRKIKLGADHPNTLLSMGNLASTYRNQGRWKESEQLELQVLETRKNKLGAEHPDTLASIGNLASTYWSQGRWEEAERLELQVLETQKIKLGADHPYTLLSMANYAGTLKSLGRPSEAIDLLRTCLDKEKRILGPTHPHVVSDSETLLAWESEHLAMKP